MRRYGEKPMKKRAGILALLLLSSTGFAQDDSKMVLDKVAFQLTAKQWVNTKTALLKVKINATLGRSDLVKTRSEIMDNLNKIAKGEWHLTAFNRSQDSSGLEKLTVDAQARVDQGSLTNVYQNAKDTSKPGTSYAISGIDFKPSLDEVQAVKAQLRQHLYQQAHEELARINQVYTDQHYSLNQLAFIEPGSIPPQPAQAREMVNMAMVAKAPSLTVSNELKMTAVVEVASTRAPDR